MQIFMNVIDVNPAEFDRLLLLQTWFQYILGQRKSKQQLFLRMQTIKHYLNVTSQFIFCGSKRTQKELKA
jgi:hypothetical protein